MRRVVLRSASSTRFRTKLPARSMVLRRSSVHTPGAPAERHAAAVSLGRVLRSVTYFLPGAVLTCTPPPDSEARAGPTPAAPSIAFSALPDGPGRQAADALPSWYHESVPPGAGARRRAAPWRTAR